MLLSIDSEHSIASDPRATVQVPRIVESATWEWVPDDEPLFLIRARDRNALAMLRYYELICGQDNCSSSYMRRIRERIEAFERYAREHEDLMRQPGLPPRNSNVHKQ